MARVLFFLALIVAAASAFVSPATNAGEFLALVEDGFSSLMVDP